MASGRQGALSLQLPGDAVLAKGYYMRHHLINSHNSFTAKRGAIIAIFHMNFMKLDSSSDFPKSQLQGSS